MDRHILALTIALTLLVINASESDYAAAQVTISNETSATSGNCSTTSCFDPQVVNIDVGKLPATAPVGNYHINTNAQVNGSTVPEFGPIVPIIFVVAVASIIIVSFRARYNSGI